MTVDLTLFNTINQLANRYEWLNWLGVFFAEYLGYILGVVVLLFLLRSFKRYWPMVVQVVAATALSRLGIVNLFHLLWQRHRPFVDYNVNLLLLPPPEASFPSGHASLFFALATVVYFHNRKSGTIFLICSFFIGIARIFCGVHWPSDIAAGIGVGILSGWVVFAGYNRLFQSRKRSAPSTKLRPRVRMEARSNKA